MKAPIEMASSAAARSAALSAFMEHTIGPTPFGAKLRPLSTIWVVVSVWVRNEPTSQDPPLMTIAAIWFAAAPSIQFRRNPFVIHAENSARSVTAPPPASGAIATQ